MAFTTIDDPELFFQTALYTGNQTGRSITYGGNSDMQPDMVWGKSRSNTDDPTVIDSSRGIGNVIAPSSDEAEGAGQTQYVTSFDSDGFGLGTNGGMNRTGYTYVNWGWKCNGGTTTTNDASATGIGSIDSVYQANTTSGFSIVTYTGNGTSGATVKHGLSSQLDVILIKNRTDAEGWQTYHRPLGATHHLSLNTTASAQDNDSRFNDVHPTSSVFTLGNNDTVNKNSSNFVAYCFADVQGYSKVSGSYTGNGNADGTFVYTGFKPAWIMRKRTDASANWTIFDNKRDTFNLADAKLKPNENQAENDHSSNGVDFLSNGFKNRTTDTEFNASGGTYIYMAFAEAPFVNSNGVPCNAR